MQRTILRKKIKKPTISEEEQEFLKEVGSLPLAITQAASYMTKRQISISQYLSLFRQSERDLTFTQRHSPMENLLEMALQSGIVTCQTWTG